MPPPKRSSAPRPARVRIIGGRQRGRLLTVVDVPGLRPSGDRVRETLFNWLQFDLAGRHCLDLFAGTGALGFEALSRGAASCVLIEQDARAAAALEQSRRELEFAGAEICRQSAFSYLAGPAPRQFDLVFLDPPFAGGFWAQALAALEHGDWLAPRALLYVESPAAAPFAPPGWLEHRSKRAGDVHFALYRRAAASAERGEPLP